MTTSIVIWLLGCGDKETETAEPVENVDIEPEPEPEPETITGTPVTISLTGSAGMKIGLVQVVFPSGDESVDTADADDDGAPEFRESIVLSSELTSETSFTFGLETPAPEDLEVLDPTSDAQLGLWAPFLFQDTNGDDAYTEDDTITGFSMTWLVYSTLDLSEFNVSEGWGALEMTFTEEVSTSGDLSNVPLDANLASVESITIGGSYDSSLGERRLAFVAPASGDDDILFPDTIYDEVVTDPWTVTFSGIPPQSHFLDSEDMLNMALQSPMVYTDENGNGSLDMSDFYVENSPVLTACYDAGIALQPIAAIYSVAPTSFETAMYSGIYGLNIGWSIMVYNDSEPMSLSGDDLNNLVIDSSCVFE